MERKPCIAVLAGSYEIFMEYLHRKKDDPRKYVYVIDYREACSLIPTSVLVLDHYMDNPEWRLILGRYKCLKVPIGYGR